MKNFKVTCSVPTTYQLNSIKTLMGSYDSHRDGSYSKSYEFDTEEEAKDFLRERLSVLFNDTDMNEDEYNKALEGIESGYLSYDAAQASVEKQYV